MSRSIHTIQENHEHNVTNSARHEGEDDLLSGEFEVNHELLGLLKCDGEHDARECDGDDTGDDVEVVIAMIVPHHARYDDVSLFLFEFDV